MNDSRDFKKEYDAFLKKVPYQTAVVDGVKVRYQYGGRDGAPVILFFQRVRDAGNVDAVCRKAGEEIQISDL